LCIINISKKIDELKNILKILIERKIKTYRNKFSKYNTDKYKQVDGILIMMGLFFFLFTKNGVRLKKSNLGKSCQFGTT